MVGRGLSSVPRFLIVTSHGRRGEEALWGLFHRTMNSIHEGAIPVTLITSQRPYFLTPSPWALGFQHVKFEEDTDIQVIAGYH